MHAFYHTTRRGAWAAPLEGATVTKMPAENIGGPGPEGAVAFSEPLMGVPVTVARDAVSIHIQAAIPVVIAHLDRTRRAIVRRGERRGHGITAVRFCQADSDGRWVGNLSLVHAAVTVEISVRHGVHHAAAFE